ncbi:MAG: Dna2/Cas4 domain-containing protein [Verrucomicrobia bacterium]|nr:Dna2/Cas4 domain-containing protein [Verrucomicrobiota bacterium]
MQRPEGLRTGGTRRPALEALSLLNDLLYCPRRAALKAVEGWRGANEHTARGDIVHEHADLAGYEVAKGVTVLRALPVWSERLGLSGKCDVVEVQSLKSKVQSLEAEVQSLELEAQGAECRSAKSEVLGLKSKVQGPKSKVGCGYESLAPVEYKKGKRRAFENDDAQLCAQGLCLEEMFGVAVERGAVFHAASKRRREVEFTAELRQVTEQAIAELHRLVDGFQMSDLKCQVSALPSAVFKPSCEECSLYEICLPEVTGAPGGVACAASRLFEI